jgi:hypothetical protein
MPRYSRRPQMLLVAAAYVGQLRFAHREPSSRFTKSGFAESFSACGDDAAAGSTTIPLTASASAEAALATAQSVLERRGYLWEPTAEPAAQATKEDARSAATAAPRRNSCWIYPRARPASPSRPGGQRRCGLCHDPRPVIAMQMRREFRAVKRAVKRALRTNGLAV